MCDTIGCISEHHLLIETGKVNMTRQGCHGVVLQIHRSSYGVDCITDIEPCIHGEKTKSNMDQKLKYSCRKIRAVITEDKHVPFCK